jgi:hypothetical protein
MIPSQIDVTSVLHTAVFHRDGSATPTVRFTYFVGKLGPFLHDWKVGDDTAENIDAFFQAEADKYIALGVVKASNV